jgi:hypothetical protein
MTLNDSKMVKDTREGERITSAHRVALAMSVIR